MGTTVDIKKSNKTMILRNGQEVDYDQYWSLRKENNFLSDDDAYTIIEERKRKAQEEIDNRQGICWENSTGKEGQGKGEWVIGSDELIRIEKMKFILSNKDMFTEEEIEKAKQYFIT